MAITANIVTIQGLSLTNTYINLSAPQIQKAKTETGNVYKLGANACVYADKTAYAAGKIPIEGFSVVTEIDLEQNLYEQGYVALKLNTRLSNVEDC